MRFAFYAMICNLLLAGCATIVKGTSQPLEVKTGAVTQAECRGIDRDGTRYLWSGTPTQVTVRKGKAPISITCEKGGYKPVTFTVEREGDNWTAGGFLFGITGGFISIVVDEATGAAGSYPESVNVEMEPTI